MTLRDPFSDRGPAFRSKRPLRILHGVGGMNRGGVETWLMNVLRRIDRRRVQFDFLFHLEQRSFFEDEIVSLGSRIYRCTPTLSPWLYAPRLFRLLRTEGPFDVVHSHVHHFSGVILAVAAAAGVPSRIAHSHSDTKLADREAGAMRRLYLRTAEGLVRRFATHGRAGSRLAAEALFGRDWEADTRWGLMYTAIDLAPFQIRTDRAELRRVLGIPENAYVIAHIGRFVAVKNHAFWLDVFSEVARRSTDARGILVGVGPLLGETKQRAKSLGLEGKVHFLGAYPDAHRLLTGVVDLFLFPSHYEGLPIAVIEAQAAGVPCLLADNISVEVDQVPELITRMRIQAGAAAWAGLIARIRRTPRPVSPSEALRRLEASPFNLQATIDDFERLYLAERR